MKIRHPLFPNTSNFFYSAAMEKKRCGNRFHAKLCSQEESQITAAFLQFKAKLPAHSQSALAAILEEVKKTGAPELHSSNHQKAARQLLLQECHGGSLGSLIQEAQLYREDGTSTTFHYANLLVYLATVYNQGGSMFELIQRQHQASASSIEQPWGLIIYCDEVVPGNILDRAERKVWCIYCTIAQFQDHLGQESAWLWCGPNDGQSAP